MVNQKIPARREGKGEKRREGHALGVGMPWKLHTYFLGQLCADVDSGKPCAQLNIHSIIYLRRNESPCDFGFS